MRGDHTQRFCEQCGKTVHNLSAGSAQAAAHVLAQDSPCVRFHTRRDGSLFTRPSRPPTGLSRAAIAGAVLIASACAPATPEAPPPASAPAAQSDLQPASHSVPEPDPVTLVKKLAMMGGGIATDCAPAPVAKPKTKRVRRSTGKPMAKSTGAYGPNYDENDPLKGL